MKKMLVLLIALHSLPILAYDCDAEVDMYNSLQNQSAKDFELSPNNLPKIDLHSFIKSDLWNEINATAYNNGAIDHYLGYGKWSHKNLPLKKIVETGRILVKSDLVDQGQLEKIIINTNEGIKVIDGLIGDYELVDLKNWKNAISFECKQVDYGTYIKKTPQALETDCLYTIVKAEYINDYYARENCRKDIKDDEPKTKKSNFAYEGAEVADTVPLSSKTLDEYDLKINDEDVNGVLSGLFAYRYKGLHFFNGSVITGKTSSGESEGMNTYMGMYKNFILSEKLTFNLGAGHAARMYFNDASSNDTLDIAGASFFGSLLFDKYKLEMNYSTVGDSFGDNSIFIIRTSFKF